MKINEGKNSEYGNSSSRKIEKESEGSEREMASQKVFCSLVFHHHLLLMLLLPLFIQKRRNLRKKASDQPTDRHKQVHINLLCELQFASRKRNIFNVLFPLCTSCDVSLPFFTVTFSHIFVGCLQKKQEKKCNEQRAAHCSKVKKREI